MKGFREFILRGNVVDLAVAVVIGGAFTAIVTALVKDFITPMVGAVAGGHGEFAQYSFTVRHSVFRYGEFLNATVSFLIVAAVVYFLVVLPVNTLLSRFQTRPDAASPTKECPQCLSKIPVLALRCAFCTAEQEPASAPRDAAAAPRATP